MGGFRLTTLLLALAIVILAGVLYQQVGLLMDAYRCPLPGRRLMAGNVRVNADIEGSGAPVVVFEAGVAATSLSWRLVQPAISKITRTISYDRAGLGWSDATWKSRDIWNLVEELRGLLKSARVHGPVILVAHSYGALIALGYASTYPLDVAGVVLVDPVAASEWAAPSASHRRMLWRGIWLARLGGVLAMLGVVRFALNSLSGGGRAMPKFLARATSGQSGAGLADRMVGQVRKLPRELWPMIQSHWSDPKSFFAVARYLKTLPANAGEILRETTRVRVPLTILSAESASAVENADRKSLERMGEHAHIETVTGTGHWIQLDRPDAVIAAVTGMIVE
jgi:pimeloyl-ACP methyl ester carboxylesterase